MIKKSTNIGYQLPSEKHTVTIKSIQNGAISSRDWAPLHSNQEWAINEGNLPNIIMNNYTLNGLIIKYITNYFGFSSRISKVKFKIIKPICPNEIMIFNGKVVNKKSINKSNSLIEINVDILVDGNSSATASVKVVINETNEDKYSPWKIPSKDWQI